MTPSRPPRPLFSIVQERGDHVITMRLSKGQRWLLFACLIALIFGGSGTTLAAVIELVKLGIGTGMIP